MDVLAMYGEPLGITALILIALNVALVIVHVYRLALHRGDAHRPESLDNMLLVSFLIMFVTVLKPLFDMWRAPSSIAASGTGDPRVILGGVLYAFMPVFINLTFCSFFFIVWVLLRGITRWRSQ